MPVGSYLHHLALLPGQPQLSSGCLSLSVAVSWDSDVSACCLFSLYEIRENRVINAGICASFNEYVDIQCYHISHDWENLTTLCLHGSLIPLLFIRICHSNNPQTDINIYKPIHLTSSKTSSFGCLEWVGAVSESQLFLTRIQGSVQGFQQSCVWSTGVTECRHGIPSDS